MGAETAIAWYLRSKRPKQRLARWLRGGAIGLAALAGLIPMLAQMSTSRQSILSGPQLYSVSPRRSWCWTGSLDSQTAGSANISTELHLRQILDEFRFDWETEVAG
jgi:hypothetical protein